MLCFPHGDSLLVCGDYYREHRGLFDALPVPVQAVECDLSGGYPHDCALDLLAVGDTLIGGKGSCDAIKARYRRFLPVRQGYVKCSVAMLKEGAAITADAGIARALETLGAEVLMIEAGHVDLPGYDCGFIGGAGGRLADGRYVWLGDYRTHPSGERIEAFARRHGVEMICLCDGRLTDHGGLIGFSARR